MIFQLKILNSNFKKINFFFNFLEKNVLIIFFFAELLSKYIRDYGEGNIRLTLPIKALFLMIFISKISLKSIYIYGSLTLVFLLSFITTPSEYLTDNVLETIISFSKYLFFPLAFFFIWSKLIDEEFNSILKKHFEFIFLVSYGLIFLGCLFEIELFRTYEGARFGYNGVFVSQNEASYILLTGFFYFFWKHENDSKKINFFKLIGAVLALCFVGTKTIYFSLILFFSIYFLYSKNIKTIISGILILVTILAITLRHSFISMFYEIYIDDGFWNALTSYRSSYIEIRFTYQIENSWSFINYLFGGAFYSDYELIEMALFDLFIFFGVVGSFIYGFIIYKAFINFKINNYGYVILSILLFASLFSGHFFMSGSVAVYLASLLLIIKKEDINNLKLFKLNKY